MSVTIKLDSSAMNTLFPEGSQARIDLARAVIVNTIESLDKKAIACITNDVLKEMQPYFDIIDRTVREANREQIQIQFGSVKLDDKLTSTIRNECRDRFNGVLKSVVNDSLETIIQNHKELIDSKVEECFKHKRIDDYIQRSADKLIIERTAEVLSNIGKLNESTNVSS